LHVATPGSLGPVTPEEASLLEKLDLTRLPRHVAVIMDGNGRWAQKRHLPRIAGHRTGTQSARTTIETCARLKIEALTLYAFSVENWRRPKTEIDFLMALLREYLRKEMPLIQKNNIRMRFLGRMDELPAGVQNDVRFLGFVPIEVLRIFYDAAKVFIFPSLYEGFGLPPLEAMAHGTPVVTSNTSSLPEVVGNAAVLVNPENVFDIMRALHRVLLDQSLREKLKLRGYEQVTKFSWDAAARQILAVYERTTGAERASPPRAEAEPVPRAANS